MQQTPKPEAQFPLEAPPLSEHSVDVWQIPVVPEVDVHSSLEKVTTLNSEKASGKKYVVFKTVFNSFS